MALRKIKLQSFQLHCILNVKTLRSGVGVAINSSAPISGTAPVILLRSVIKTGESHPEGLGLDGLTEQSAKL